MTILVIEHLKASELPEQWAERLDATPEQKVTVRIETEAETMSTQPELGTYKTDDPAYGIWRDRDDINDVDAYVRRLRAPRYSRG